MTLNTIFLQTSGLGDSIINILQSLYAAEVGTANTLASTITGKLNVIAAIAALLYIFSSLTVQVVQNQSVNFFPLLRPFVLLLLIPYSGEICSAIDTTVNEIKVSVTAKTGSIEQKIQATNNKLIALIDKKWETIANNKEAYEAAYPGRSYTEDSESFYGAGQAFIDIKTGFNKWNEQMEFSFLKVLQSILLGLTFVAEAILLMLSIAYRTILRAVFPISLVVAMFPGFSGNLSSWFGRYLNSAFLPMVAAIYTSFVFTIIEKYVTSYDVESSLSKLGQETVDPTYLGMGFTVVLAMALCGYLMIPTMTSWIVSSGGMQHATAGITGLIGRNIINPAKKQAKEAGKTYAEVGKAVNYEKAQGGVTPKLA